MIHNYNLSKLFPQEMMHHASGGACATSLGGNGLGQPTPCMGWILVIRRATFLG